MKRCEERRVIARDRLVPNSNQAGRFAKLSWKTCFNAINVELNRDKSL